MPRVQANGLEINYDEWGEGPPLVLVHANPFDNTLWLYQTAHFSTYYRVIAPDVRGYGRSSKPSSKFGIKDLSEDVFAVCRSLGLDEAVFGGISVGSSIIQQLAADHPEMVRALILAGSGYHPTGTRRKFADERAKGYASAKGYREVHMRALVTEEFQKSKLGAYLLSTFLERDPAINTETIVRLFEGYLDWDQSAATASLTCPALVVVGEKDGGLKGCLELHERIAGSEFSVIKGAGHACCLENPSDFDAVVLDFLSRHGLMPKAPSAT